MKLEKNNTLFCDKLVDLKINDLLGEIFRKLTNFNIHNGYCPENILLTYEDYLRIKKERDELISFKNGEEYILCMKISKINRDKTARKLNFRDKLKLNSLFQKNKRSC